MLDTIDINVVNLMGMKPGQRAVTPKAASPHTRKHTDAWRMAVKSNKAHVVSALVECVCLAGRSSYQRPVGDFEYLTTHSSVPVFLCFLEQHGGTLLLFGDRVAHWFWRVMLSICAYVYAFIAGLFHCRNRNKQHPQTNRLHTFVSAWIPQWQRCDIPVALSQTDSHIPLSPHSQHLSHSLSTLSYT